MLTCPPECMQDEQGFSEVCRDYMHHLHMWPGAPEYGTMAALHMGYHSASAAKRADLPLFNKVKMLVSTCCPCPHRCQMP